MDKYLVEEVNKSIFVIYGDKEKRKELYKQLKTSDSRKISNSWVRNPKYKFSNSWVRNSKYKNKNIRTLIKLNVLDVLLIKKMLYFKNLEPMALKSLVAGETFVGCLANLGFPSYAKQKKLFIFAGKNRPDLSHLLKDPGLNARFSFVEL